MVLVNLKDENSEKKEIKSTVTFISTPPYHFQENTEDGFPAHVNPIDYVLS